MSAIEKLVEWFDEGICEGDGKLIMDKARQLLAEEQAQKPTAPAGLMEEIYKVNDEGLRVDFKARVLDILSRYTPQEEKPPANADMVETEFGEWLRIMSEKASYSDQRELLRVVLKHYDNSLAQEKPTAPASDKKWHDLKVVSPHWEALKANIKPFEIRKNDRDYKVGDGLALRHWRDGEYVVNEAPQYFVVEYITDFPDGIKEGYVVMGLSRYARPTSGQEGKVEKEQSRERLAYCPTCSAEIKSTERRPDGDSVCVNGHKHKTKEFFHYHPSTDKCEKEPRHE